MVAFIVSSVALSTLLRFWRSTCSVIFLVAGQLFGARQKARTQLSAEQGLGQD